MLYRLLYGKDFFQPKGLDFQYSNQTNLYLYSTIHIEHQNKNIKQPQQYRTLKNISPYPHPTQSL